MIPDDIPKAARLLHEGGLVAFPTETVYGLGADATNEVAVRKIFAVKERPTDHPLIVHIAGVYQLEQWAKEVSPLAMQAAKAFWPGPLTLVLKKQPRVSEVLTGGQDTIALRVPRHPVAVKLLDAFGGGIAAPSANKFTRISPTTAAAVYEELHSAVDLILDGGACEIGLESTILDMSGEKPVILRPGMITKEMLEEEFGMQVALRRQDTPAPRAPGQHHLHYAPKTKTQIIKTEEIRALLQALPRDELPVVCLVHSQTSFPHIDHVQWVNMPADAAGYAHDIYRTLRALDVEHYKQILIEAVPNDLAWNAIQDRLTKATGMQ